MPIWSHVLENGALCKPISLYLIGYRWGHSRRVFHCIRTTKLAKNCGKGLWQYERTNITLAHGEWHSFKAHTTPPKDLRKKALIEFKTALKPDLVLIARAVDAQGTILSNNWSLVTNAIVVLAKASAWTVVQGCQLRAKIGHIKI